MKILVSSAKLADVARTATFAVRHRDGGRFPILNCCRLTADGNLSIYGTDLDTGISASADCNVFEPGEAVVDAQRLADIAAKLKGDVSIHITATDLSIKCGRVRLTLTMMPVEDYPPPLAVEDNVPAVDLTAGDVMALFNGAATAAATKDDRIYLAGPVLFGEPADFGYRLCGVGTDTVSLSYAATTAQCVDMRKGRIVHRETCKLAVKLFGETGASIQMGESLIELTSADRRVTAKLVGAEPTAWRSMLPPLDQTNAATVAMSDLVAALERCLAVINNIVGGLAKGAPSVSLRWDAATGSEVCVSFGDINAPPAALDGVPAVVAAIPCESMPGLTALW